MAKSVSIHHKITEAESWLASKDRKLAALIDSHGPCTIYQKPALYHQTAFHVLVWSIINQQLSVASAHSIERRLLQHHPARTFQVKVIDSLQDSDLRACGLSRQKIRYIRSLCEHSNTSSLRPGRLRSMSNDEVSQHLICLPGIGPWTVDMMLMFYLGRLDVLPLGDLALRKAIALTYKLDAQDTDSMQKVAKKWSPYRTIASWYLWCVVD